MAFDGIVVANLVHELRNELFKRKNRENCTAGNRRTAPYDQGVCRTEASLPVRKRISSFDIFNRYQQTKSDDSAELLHAAQKTHCERTYRGYLSAKAGANHPLYD